MESDSRWWQAGSDIALVSEPAPEVYFRPRQWPLSVSAESDGNTMSSSAFSTALAPRRSWFGLVCLVPVVLYVASNIANVSEKQTEFDLQVPLLAKSLEPHPPKALQHIANSTTWKAARQEGSDDGTELSDEQKEALRDEIAQLKQKLLELENQLRAANDHKAEDNDDADDVDIVPIVVISLYDKVKLQVGWLVGFICIVSMLVFYIHMQEYLAPYAEAPLESGHSESSNDCEAIWKLLNGNLYFALLVFALAAVNFYTFTVATEALYDDEHGTSLLPPGWPLLVNECVAFGSWLVFAVITVLRLLTVHTDPYWARFGLSAPFRYSVASVYTLFEILALVFSFKCHPFHSHNRNQANFLWLFLVRSFEVLERSGMGLGVRRLRHIITEDGKLLSVGFIFGVVLWTIMSGLYFLTNKECPEEGCPEMADWPAYVYQYHWSAPGEPAAWRKFESIPSSGWYVLINLVKEHPLADAHAFFWQRLNVCIVCIFAMPLFALPMSILSYSIFRTAKEGALELAADASPGPGNAQSRMTFAMPYVRHAARHNFDPSLGPLLTAILSYGSIVAYWFYTARGMPHATIFTVAVDIDRKLLMAIDCFVALVFAAEWMFHLVIIGKSYAKSLLGLVDIGSWLLGLVHCIWWYITPGGVPELLAAGCVIRVFKLERFLGNFGDLYKIAKRNRLLLLATSILSMLIWMIVSTLLWLTDGCIMHGRQADGAPLHECKNNDPEQTEQYASVERSLWAEIINIHGEWPWADYTPEGKAVGTIIALFAIVLFCVPISVFAEGYQEQIAAARTEDDMNFDSRPWQAKCRPQHRGLGQVAYDLFYSHMHCRPGDRPVGFRVLRAVSATVVLINVMVTMCCTVERLDMPAFWREPARYDGLMAVCYWIDVASAIFFCCEFNARVVATDWRHACSLAGVADILSLVAVLSTVTNEKFRKEAFHPEYDSLNIKDDCVVLLRVLRLFCLESYTAAIHVLKTVLWLNRWPLLRSGQTLAASWFVHATLLYLCERPYGHRFHRSGENGEMSRRYTDMLRALQYSIVHLFGDYPESDYGFAAKVVHFCGIMFGIAILSSFAGVFSASFVNYVRRAREEQLAHVRSQRLLMATRIASRIQRQFRKWRVRAKQHSAALRRAGDGRITMRPTVMRRRPSWRDSLIEAGASISRFRSNPRLMSANVVEGRSIAGWLLRFLFQVTLVTNLFTTMILSMPELDEAEGRQWRKVCFLMELASTFIFTVEFLIKLPVATRTTAGWRIVDAIALLPGYAMAGFEVISDGWTQAEKENIASFLQALAMFRVIRILDFPYIRREVMLICRSLRDAWGLLAVPAYLSLTVWIATSALFMWVENYFKAGSEWSEAENMKNLPSTMYWCCMFLTGEWANVDFTYPGSRLCIFYVIFGIAVFSIPVGILVEAIHSTATLAHAEEQDMRKLLNSMSTDSLANEEDDKFQPPSRECNVEMSHAFGSSEC